MQIPGMNPMSFEDEYYRIYIQDNGIGFEQEYADQIFTVFKRLHSFDKYEGTGIGLSICKKIAEKHSGTIAARSKVNEGSTFIITLPATKKELVSKATV
jgi:light-regulated signal transduction histidine kinase (bacteriophytochrome)